MYNVLPADKMKLSFNQFPPSPVDFTHGQQNYATACNSPTWTSPMAFAQKPDVDNSFYQNSSALLSTNQDWNSSTMSHYPTVDCAPDPNSSFMLPSQDTSASFMTEVDASHHEDLPTFIAPSQAVHQPEIVDYNMSISGWGGLQTPMHDSTMLQSSSPSEFSPVTPPTLDSSFDSSYVKHEISPSSSVYGHTSRSSLGKKGRKISKADKRRSICKSVPVSNSTTSITLLTDERSEIFHGLNDEDKKNFSAGKKMHKCKTCNSKFGRSEHCKRHEDTHSGESKFHCYLWDHRLDPNNPKSQCTVGKNGDGRQNRGDNNRYHHWTHVKAYLVLNDALVRERSKTVTGKAKSRGRNYPVSPMQFLTMVRSQGSLEQQEKVLSFMNGESGRDFGIHILWDKEGCPVVPCSMAIGAGACTMCRSKQGKKEKK